MQADLFSALEKPVEYEVHYHPPDYPDHCFPSRCGHEGPYAMCANVELVPRKDGGSQMQIDHLLCLFCGMPQPATYGGNVLVDCQMILAEKGARHWKIALRVQRIREKWSRLATYLFDENGWNGRHERIARIIDPRLTMKLTFEGQAADGTRLARIAFDPEYLRPCEEAA